MKPLSALAGCMLASTIAFFGVNEFLLNNLFSLAPSLWVGATMGFISALVLGVNGANKAISASIISAATLGGLFLVLGFLASFSANYAPVSSLSLIVEAFTIVGLAGGLGYVFGGKVG